MPGSAGDGPDGVDLGGEPRALRPGPPQVAALPEPRAADRGEPGAGRRSRAPGPRGATDGPRGVRRRRGRPARQPDGLGPGRDPLPARRDQRRAPFGQAPRVVDQPRREPGRRRRPARRLRDRRPDGPAVQVQRLDRHDQRRRRARRRRSPTAAPPRGQRQVPPVQAVVGALEDLARAVQRPPAPPPRATPARRPPGLAGRGRPASRPPRTSGRSPRRSRSESWRPGPSGLDLPGSSGRQPRPRGPAIVQQDNASRRPDKPPAPASAPCFAARPRNNTRSRPAAPSPTKERARWPAATDVVEIPVAGMTCDHCVGTVRRALEGVPGVRSAVGRPGRRPGRGRRSTPAGSTAPSSSRPSRPPATRVPDGRDRPPAPARHDRPDRRPSPPPAAEPEEWNLAIGGMHCASCVARVEGALRGVPGVAEARVNLATERAGVGSTRPGSTRRSSPRPSPRPATRPGGPS